MIPTEPGIYFGVAERDYNRIKALRSSSMKKLLESPLDFWQESPWNPEWDADQMEQRDSKALKKGDAFHKLLLTPDDFFACYNVMPGRVLDPTKKVIFRNEYESIVNSIGLLKSMPTIYKLFEGGEPEVVVIFEDAFTGVLCKTRHDFFKAMMTADYKTAEDLSDDHIKRNCWKYSYDIQAWLYRESRKAMKRLLQKHGRDVIHGMNHTTKQFVDLLIAASQREITDQYDELFVHVFQKPIKPHSVRALKLDEMDFARGEKKATNAMKIFEVFNKRFGETEWKKGLDIIEDFSMSYGTSDDNISRYLNMHYEGANV